MCIRDRSGTVVSTKMDKTTVVLVEKKKMHPLYKKQYRTSKKYFAHDEENKCQVGNIVVISETRPLSKNKSWKIDKIIEETK
jgi:small subunit ribosomal protein S17